MRLAAWGARKGDIQLGSIEDRIISRLGATSDLLPYACIVAGYVAQLADAIPRGFDWAKWYAPMTTYDDENFDKLYAGTD